MELDLKRAQETAKLSLLVYGEPQDCVTRLKNLGYKAIQFFDVDGAQAVACLDKDATAIIAFRGTQPNKLSDIAADLKAWRDDAQLGGKIHEGFQDEVDKVWFAIQNWLAQTKYKTIITTGHSLGAAMATVAASRLKEATVYNFGSPRVGDKVFKKLFDAKYTCYRFVNNNDIVCRIPTAIRFRHVGNCYYITQEGDIIKNAGWHTRVSNWFIGHWHAIKKLQFFDGLFDHGMDRYYNRVKVAEEILGEKK